MHPSKVWVISQEICSNSNFNSSHFSPVPLIDVHKFSYIMRYICVSICITLPVFLSIVKLIYDTFSPIIIPIRSSLRRPILSWVCNAIPYIVMVIGWMRSHTLNCMWNKCLWNGSKCLAIECDVLGEIPIYWDDSFHSIVLMRRLCACEKEQIKRKSAIRDVHHSTSLFDTMNLLRFQWLYLFISNYVSCGYWDKNCRSYWSGH